MSSLDCKGLSYRINDKEIFSNVDFSLSSGEHLLILGASGCGKTSLLTSLIGLQKPSKGQVIYDNQDLYALGESARDSFRGANMGVIFQNFHLVKFLTVYENLTLSCSLSGKNFSREWILSCLDKVDLADKEKQKVEFLSVGEKQRLAIVRSLVTKPQWIFCDEPSSALDDKNTEKVLSLLQEQAKACHSSLLIVTHDKRVKSNYNSSKIIELGGVD